MYINFLKTKCIFLYISARFLDVLGGRKLKFEFFLTFWREKKLKVYLKITTKCNKITYKVFVHACLNKFTKQEWDPDPKLPIPIIWSSSCPDPQPCRSLPLPTLF